MEKERLQKAKVNNEKEMMEERRKTNEIDSTLLCIEFEQNILRQVLIKIKDLLDWRAEVCC